MEECNINSELSELKRGSGSNTTANTQRFKLGIPRGLLYFKYAPLWVAFLEYLDCEVVFSPPTTAKIIEEGSKAALSELCVPMKTYYGHVKALIRENPDLDYIFIPRYVSTHSTQYFCPKFLILPEAIKYGVPEVKNIPILTLEVNAKKMRGIEGAIKIGEQLGRNREKVGTAWYFAMDKYKKFRARIRKGGSLVSILDEMDKNPDHARNPSKQKAKISPDLQGKYMVNVMILGHAYNVYEAYINMDMTNRLKALDCNVLTLEQLPKEVFEKPITINKQYHNYWENEEEIMQTARYYLTQSEKKLDGIIFLISFACGPDSLIQELLIRDMKRRKIPFLALILDEHSGEAGISTRVESFVDMLRREKYREREPQPIIKGEETK